jgi:hypothetical protein
VSRVSMLAHPSPEDGLGRGVVLGSRQAGSQVNRDLTLCDLGEPVLSYDSLVVEC